MEHALAPTPADEVVEGSPRPGRADVLSRDTELTPGLTDPEVLRRQNQALSVLARSLTLGDTDLDTALRLITEEAGLALVCERVRVWRRDRAGTRCLHAFTASTTRHQADVGQSATFATLMTALVQDGPIAATDALTHAGIREYLAADPQPLAITSVLAVGLMLGNELVGFVAFEHVGGVRRWRSDEIGFARAIAGVAGLALGASERSKTAAALRESEERFRLLAENMTDLVCLHDWQGQYVWVSPSCKRVLGFEVSELIGTDHFALIHPEDAPRVRSSLWARMRRGESVLPTIYRIRNKSGEYGWVETLAERVVKDGDVVRLQTSSREVTDRIAAEQIIAQSEERYRTVVSNTVDGIVLIDGATLKVIDANPAFETLVGYRLGELAKLAVTDLLRDREGVDFTVLVNAIAERRPYHGEQKYRRKDGVLIDLEVNAHAITYRGRSVICAVARDVTDRKREVQLEQDRAKALELIATGEPLDATLLHLTELVERHCVGLTCTFTLDPTERLADFSQPEGASAFSLRSQPTAHGQSFAAPLLSAQGELLGLFSGISALDQSPSAHDLGVFMMAARLGAIALDQKALNLRLAHQAQHDELTGLPNRRRLQNRLAVALAEAQTSGRGVALLFVDLDRFKLVNDTLGHTVGDRLLAEAARRIGRVVRGHDTVARMGGDEFIVVATALNEPEKDGLILSDRILATLSRPFNLEDREIVVTASIGLATYPIDALDGESLVKHADTALYQAKVSGRNRVISFTPDLHAAASSRMELERQLRGALERDELVAYYQPQFDTVTRRLIGMEALVRWQHPSRGLLLPGEFLPVAEEIGLLTAIDHWVLKKAAAQTNIWHTQGHKLRLSVNLSSRHFRSADIADQVRAVLVESGLRPEFLELELTETTAMENAEAALEILQRIKQTGVSISIDDFGTGYSSLSYLKRFPIDALKIDRAFVTDIGTESDNSAIAVAIVAMARALKVRVIAEGVETSSQLEFLKWLGCDEVQGFFLGHPLSTVDFEALLETLAAAKEGPRAAVP